ncbi:MAG: toxin-antitoxin system YwqK family antitoxin [Bacteroidota bacterium]
MATKYITAVLSLLFIFHLYGQEVNKTDAKGRKQGPWQKTYPDSRAFEYKGQFKDDKPVGTFYYFYPSTKKKAIVVHDELSGRSVAYMYHETGVDLAYGIYRNMKKDSVWTYYGPSGKVSYKETFKEGKLNGKKTVFYVSDDPADKSLRVAMVQHYANDVLQGEEIEYFEDGSVKSKGTYDKGQRSGRYVINNINGNNIVVENYKNGTLHGWCYGYDDNGKELGKKFYKNGKELKGKELDKWLKYCKDNKIDPTK